MTTCAHCDRPAEWEWVNESNQKWHICSRCIETVSPYMYSSLWQFSVLQKSKENNER
jgi:hypothetical protein